MPFDPERIASLSRPRANPWNVWSGKRPLHLSPIAESGLMACARQLPDSEGNGLYFGIAGIANLQFIAMHNPKSAILGDINENQHLLWHRVLEAIRASPTAAEGARALSYTIDALLVEGLEMTGGKLISEDANGVFRVDPHHERYVIASMAADPESWLGNETLYQRIRTLALNDRIVPITCDVLDKKTFETLAKQLGDDKVTVFYLSNLPEFFLAGNARATHALAANLTRVCAADAVVIDTDKYTVLQLQAQPLSRYLEKLCPSRGIGR